MEHELVFNQIKLKVPGIHDNIRVIHVTPTFYQPTDEKYRAQSKQQLKELFGSIFNEERSSPSPFDSARLVPRTSSPLNDPPLFLQLPEMFSDPETLLSLLKSSPPGVIFVSGLLGDNTCGWFTAAGILELINSIREDDSIEFELEEAIESWLAGLHSESLVNIVIFGATQQEGAPLKLGIRPKVAPAPTGEVSMTPEENIEWGRWITLLEVEPPEGHHSDGLTIMPLICSEYFAQHPDSSQTIHELIKRRGNGLHHKTTVDLISVVNICKSTNNCTTWPTAFLEMIDKFHRSNPPYRTAHSMSSFTSPIQYNYGTQVTGAATGIAIPVRFWGSVSQITPIDGMQLSTKGHGDWEEVQAEDTKPEYIRKEPCSMIFWGIRPSIENRNTWNVLTYKFSIPRLQAFQRHQVPVKAMQVIEV